MIDGPWTLSYWNWNSKKYENFVTETRISVENQISRCIIYKLNNKSIIILFGILQRSTKWIFRKCRSLISRNLSSSKYENLASIIILDNFVENHTCFMYMYYHCPSSRFSCWSHYLPEIRENVKFHRFFSNYWTAHYNFLI